MSLRGRKAEGGGAQGVAMLVYGGGGGHEASVSVCLPLAAPIGLSPLHILTLCGSERVFVVSTEPPDDLSCWTTAGVGRPGDGAVPCADDQGHPGAHSESMRGFADSSTDLGAPVCTSAGSFPYQGLLTTTMIHSLCPFLCWGGDQGPGITEHLDFRLGGRGQWGAGGGGGGSIDRDRSFHWPQRCQKE